jgi:hypothetical protein
MTDWTWAGRSFESFTSPMRGATWTRKSASYLRRVVARTRVVAWGSQVVACAAQAAGGCRESPGKSELINSLGRDTEELGDVGHLPQLDLVPAEEHVSELRESVPMLDQLGCRGRIPPAPIADKNAGLKQPLDTTKPKLAGGPVGLGEGAGLDLDPPE